jgi:hypothetical protein
LEKSGQRNDRKNDQSICQKKMKKNERVKFDQRTDQTKKMIDWKVSQLV